MKEKIQCKICGKSWKHLGSHLWHKHKVLAREYKEEFGLPFKMSLISKEVREKKQVAFEKTKDIVIKNLLGRNSKKYRFKKGQSGYRRISEYEKRKILERIVNYNKQSKPEPCPVCKMVFDHTSSHLFNKHGLLKVK